MIIWLLCMRRIFFPISCWLHHLFCNTKDSYHQKGKLKDFKYSNMFLRAASKLRWRGSETRTRLVSELPMTSGGWGGPTGLAMEASESMTSAAEAGPTKSRGRTPCSRLQVMGPFPRPRLLATTGAASIRSRMVMLAVLKGAQMEVTRLKKYSLSPLLMLLTVLLSVILAVAMTEATFRRAAKASHGVQTDLYSLSKGQETPWGRWPCGGWGWENWRQLLWAEQPRGMGQNVGE